MFPERPDERRRPILPIALLVSVLLHLAGAGTWLFFNRDVAPVVAKLFPRPSPTPEIVALSDAITIEKRTVPRQARRAQPHRRRPVSRPQPRRVAQLPALQAPPVPTLAPLPTPLPTTEATYRPLRGTIHHPRSAPSRPPQHAPAVKVAQLQKPAPAEKPAPRSARNAFSPQQIAALDAQFQRTIDSSRRSLTDVPPQRRPPARNAQQPKYEAIMAGTPEQFLAAQGVCYPIQAHPHGALIDRYIWCTITYSDGFFENVTFPWLYRFTRRNDPFQYNDGSTHSFPMQGPPEGFVLPHPFALSRAVCSFYRAQCQSIIDRERANGNQPATGGG